MAEPPEKRQRIDDGSIKLPKYKPLPDFGSNNNNTNTNVGYSANNVSASSNCSSNKIGITNIKGYDAKRDKIIADLHFLYEAVGGSFYLVGSVALILYAIQIIENNDIFSNINDVQRKELKTLIEAYEIDDYDIVMTPNSSPKTLCHKLEKLFTKGFRFENVCADKQEDNFLKALGSVRKGIKMKYTSPDLSIKIDYIAYKKHPNSQKTFIVKIYQNENITENITIDLNMLGEYNSPFHVDFLNQCDNEKKKAKHAIKQAIYKIINNYIVRPPPIVVNNEVMNTTPDTPGTPGTPGTPDTPGTPVETRCKQDFIFIRGGSRNIKKKTNKKKSKKTSKKSKSRKITRLK
jgi:hypothetical protein